MEQKKSIWLTKFWAGNSPHVNVHQFLIPTISEPDILGSLATWRQLKCPLNTTLTYHRLLSWYGQESCLATWEIKYNNTHFHLSWFWSPTPKGNIWFRYTASCIHFFFSFVFSLKWQWWEQWQWICTRTCIEICYVLGCWKQKYILKMVESRCWGDLWKPYIHICS